MPRIALSKLIEIAKQNIEAIYDTPQLNEVQRFILMLDMKEGKFRVKSALIYKAYRMWSKKPKADKLTRGSFFNYFTIHMPNDRINIAKYYYLNYRPIELILAVMKQRER